MKFLITVSFFLIATECVFAQNEDSNNEPSKDYIMVMMDTYNKLIELNPNSSSAYSNRGNVKARLEDYRGAIQDYSKVIDLAPNTLSAYYNRGLCKYELGDYKGAMQDYSKVIELDPKDLEAYMNRGACKILTNNKNEGCLDFSKAGELGHEKAYDMIKEYCN